MQKQGNEALHASVFSGDLDHTFYTAAAALEQDENLDSDDDDSLIERVVYGTSEDPAPPKAKVVSIASPSTLGVYYAQISKIPPLTRQQEVQAFMDYAKAHKNIRMAINKLPIDLRPQFKDYLKDLNKNYSKIKIAVEELEDPNVKDTFKNLLQERNQIRDKFVTSNLRFVIKIAKTFWRDGNIETLKNLISVGNLGLFDAIDKFDLKHGTRFLSYAAHWIALQIRLEVAADDTVQIPLWWRKLIYKLSTAYDKAGNPNMTAQELSDATEVSLKHIDLLNNQQVLVRRDNLCLSTYVFELSSRDEFMMQRDQLHDAEYVRLVVRKQLQEYISELPTREQGVLRLLFGLSYENRELNLRQIGNIYGLTTERIRQVKEKALDKLRCRLKRLGYNELDDIL